MCCFVRTQVYVCVHNLCNFREEGCDWTPNVTGCTLQSVHVSVPLCLKSKSLLAMKYNNKVCFRQFWGTTRVICTDRQKEREGGGGGVVAHRQDGGRRSRRASKRQMGDKAKWIQHIPTDSDKWQSDRVRRLQDTRALCHNYRHQWSRVTVAVVRIQISSARKNKTDSSSK